MPPGTLAVTGDHDADALVNQEPLALLLGMLLDQQVPMEWAFRGPLTLQRRLGGLDADAIAAMTPDALEQTFATKPALHRYPGAMAKRAHALCQYLVEHYDGDPEQIWNGADDAATVLARLEALPGYGSEKARILLAVLGKRMGVRPAGWEQAAAPFSDEVPRSVADIDSPEALERVREWKKQQKARGRSKAE